VALLINLQHKPALKGVATFNAIIELLLHKVDGILDR